MMARHRRAPIRDVVLIKKEETRRERKEGKRGEREGKEGRRREERMEGD